MIMQPSARTASMSAPRGNYARIGALLPEDVDGVGSLPGAAAMRDHLRAFAAAAARQPRRACKNYGFMLRLSMCAFEPEPLNL